MMKHVIRRSIGSSISTLGVIFGIVSISSASAMPVIYDLGTLGGTRSHGYAVNDVGQVTGYSYITGSSLRHAFRYDGTPGIGGIMRDLGTLGGTVSEGAAINNAGQVSGQSQTASNTAWHAFRYDGTPGAGGIMRDLGTLGGLQSYGLGVNDAGQVAGSAQPPSTSEYHAFRYDGTPGAGGVMRDLGTLAGKTTHAHGINSTGQMTGSAFISAQTPHAFRYDVTPGSDGVLHDLGTLGGAYSEGWGINDAGQVVGYAVMPGNTAAHAFLYTGMPGSGGVMHDLHTLDAPSSYAHAINKAGQVVGFTQEIDSGGAFLRRAFLYPGTPDAGGIMVDLDVWLDVNNPTDGAKWTLTEARGISNTGWITGTGTYDPDGTGGPTAASTRAFLLRLPKPGDANDDDIVDSVDFGILAANYGTMSGATYLTGDFTFDNKVTTLDFNILAANFGGEPASSLPAVVPEPASFALLVLGAMILPRRRMR